MWLEKKRKDESCKLKRTFGLTSKILQSNFITQRKNEQNNREIIIISERNKFERLKLVMKRNKNEDKENVLWWFNDFVYHAGDGLTIFMCAFITYAEDTPDQEWDPHMTTIRCNRSRNNYPCWIVTRAKCTQSTRETPSNWINNDCNERRAYDRTQIRATAVVNNRRWLFGYMYFQYRHSSFLAPAKKWTLCDMYYYLIKVICYDL